MSSIGGQIVLTALAGASLIYFASTWDPGKKGTGKSSLERMTSQVSYRDPKLIEEHKKKLEENKKLRNK